MVKRATWRKVKEIRLGRYRITLYRDKEHGRVFRAEISEDNMYCGDIYFYFEDEIVLLCHVGGMTIDDVHKVLSRLEDLLQRWRGLSEKT